jgi:hypothetical protein
MTQGAPAQNDKALRQCRSMLPIFVLHRTAGCPHLNVTMQNATVSQILTIHRVKVTFLCMQSLLAVQKPQKHPGCPHRSKCKPQIMITSRPCYWPTRTLTASGLQRLVSLAEGLCQLCGHPTPNLLEAKRLCSVNGKSSYHYKQLPLQSETPGQ